MEKKIQKPFDLEKVKKGARVETRDGKSVRIVCYDRISSYPILALIFDGKAEICYTYKLDGSLGLDAGTNSADLVIVEEVEIPKFKEGAFIVVNGDVYEVSDVDDVNNLYYFQNVKSGFSQKLPTKNIDNICNRWNTNDVRPGDVLIDCHNKPFLFKGYTDKEHPGCPVAYCGINSLDVFTISSINYYWSNEHVRPATYKERQQFFNKLEEEGYKWDAESLTLSKIQKRWRDKEDAQIDGYFINGMSQISFRPGYNTCCYNNLFATEKQAKSVMAMARISQIMKNDERFGGVVTNNEWDSAIPYFVITKIHNMLIITRSHRYEYLGFHSVEQANLFLEENEDLVKDYYMMD